MMLFKYVMFWTFILLALCHIYCEARAVNVSNTWTMPQEGLNVFYRFFRDRISWFEADAVCQFHHASLVTVDNSFQFDATRDLLRELDVNDIVWIGLIRPQSSERFMWSNSRPLIANTGYWAESLPIMEAPLCAVIDPIRDYRWHALRCGGPETASFLCEMTVPTWADACILKDIPNLTMQYMADTASVELIRSCQEEGTLRQTCKGKQDRERIIRELVCPRERMEAQRINDITSSHFKSLKIINSVHTDNNENNDIELVPISVANYDPSSELADSQSVTEKNTVQRLIEQFNVDELMQADQPVLGMTAYKIPDEIPKPVKKFAKKYTTNEEYQKKENVAKTNQKTTAIKPEALALEDMMLGDQPQGEPELVEHVFEDEVSNEIMEVLPHRKKILPQDLKTMPSIVETTETPLATTVHNLIITSSSQPSTHLPKGDEISAHSATPAISHPIHPHETHEENPHTHKTDSTSITDNSHFIPPMLMVKSHYVPPNKHAHEHEHEHEKEHEHEHNHERHMTAMDIETASTTSSTLSTTTRNTQTQLPITTTTTTREVVDNDISVSTSQSPVRTSPGIEKQTTEITSTTPTTTTTTTTTTVMTPIPTHSNLNPTEGLEKKDLKETTTTIVEKVHENTTISRNLAEVEEATTKTIKSIEILSSTELPELRKSVTNAINNKANEPSTTTTTTITVTSNDNKEKSSEESSEEQNKYERLFASQTTPVSAKEFETNVAAAFAAASQVGQQQQQHEPELSLEAKTTEAAVATTQQATTTIIAPTSSTQTTFTTTVQPIFATTTTLNGIVDTEEKADDVDDKIGLTTNVNELESLSTIEPITIMTTTTTTPSITSTTSKKQPLILTTTTTATIRAISSSPASPTIENKTINDDELGQDIARTTQRHDFLWSDTTTTTFKPNRRRLLTKPETGSYFKKILG